MRSFWLLLVLSAALSGCANFGVVEEGKVYRRSQPSEEALNDLIEERGIKTVLRLRGGKPGSSGYDDSYNPTVKHGVRFVQIPMSASRFPKDWELVQMIETFEQGPYPIVIHCKAGADRTGLASAIYRIMQGEPVATADNELSMWHGHLSMFGTEKLGETLDMYAPWQPWMSIGQWAREIYQRPQGDLLPENFAAQNEAALEAWIASNRAQAFEYNLRWRELQEQREQAARAATVRRHNTGFIAERRTEPQAGDMAATKQRQPVGLRVKTTTTPPE